MKDTQEFGWLIYRKGSEISDLGLDEVVRRDVAHRAKTDQRIPVSAMGVAWVSRNFAGRLSMSALAEDVAAHPQTLYQIAIYGEG